MWWPKTLARDRKHKGGLCVCLNGSRAGGLHTHTSLRAPEGSGRRSSGEPEDEKWPPQPFNANDRPSLAGASLASALARHLSNGSHKASAKSGQKLGNSPSLSRKRATGQRERAKARARSRCSPLALRSGLNCSSALITATIHHWRTRRAEAQSMATAKVTARIASRKCALHFARFEYSQVGALLFLLMAVSSVGVVVVVVVVERSDDPQRAKHAIPQSIDSHNSSAFAV